MKVETIVEAPMLTGDWVHTLQDRARERYSRRYLPAGEAYPVANGAEQPAALPDVEWLRWVACLDGLLSLSRVGGDEVVRRLGLAKLQFLLRRAQWLHERVLVRGRLSARACMSELRGLQEEWRQVVLELGGRSVPAVDEWPFPYRLFSRRQPLAGAMLFPPLARMGGERRAAARQGDNVLREEECKVAESVLNQLGYTLSVLERAHALSRHPEMEALKDEQFRQWEFLRQLV